MALTKVSGGILDPGINVAGIVTATGFDGPFVGGSSKNITAGIVTATSLDLNGSGDISGNLVVHGNLTANGDFTTLNTTLREVELFRVDANSSAAAGIITQRGSGNILDLYDGSTEVFSVTDGGTILAGGTSIPGYTGADDLTIGSESGNHGITIRSSTTGGGGLFFSDATSAGDNSTQWAGGIEYNHGNGELRFYNGNNVTAMFKSGHFQPWSDSQYSLGTSSKRWSNVHADAATIAGVVTATSFTASNSGVTGQYTRNQIIWDRNSYNYIDCSNDSGQFAFRMGSSQTVPFSIDTNADTTFPNERKLKFGSNTSHQLHIYHTVSGSSSHIIESNSNSNHLVLKATTIGPRANYFNFRNYANNANAFTVDVDDATTLYFNGTPRLETASSRVVIRGSSGLGVYGETGANNDGHVTVHPTGNAVYSRIQFYNAAGNSYAQVFAHAGQTLFLDSANNGQINYRANGTGDHIFQNNGQQTATILDSGFVGIGSGTPSTLLDVNRGSAATIQLKNTGTVNSMALYIGSSTNSIYSRGANSSTARDFTFLQGNSEILRINAAGNLTFKNTSSQGNSFTHSFRVNDTSGNSQYQLGMVSTGNEDLYLIQSRNANLRFHVNGSTRWKIDPSGHLLPETAGAVNIGSASVGIGSVFLADNKKISFGDAEDFQIYHSSGNVTLIDSPTNRQVQLKGDGGLLIRAGGNQNIANFVQSGVTLYHSVGNNYTARFVTTSTGITVTGEVAATQDYPQSDPNIDFVFTRAKKLDPRLTYRRSGTASYVDKNGMIKMVGDNVPRFDHDPLTRECKGLLLEPASSNRIHSSTSGIPNVPYAIYGTNSNANSDKSGFSADTLAPDGSKWTQKVSWKGATFSANGYYRIGVMNMGTFDAGDYTVSTFVKRGIDGNHNLDTLFAGTSPLGSSQYHVAIEQYSPSYASASANWVTTSGVKIQKFQNGWYRISVPLTVSSSFNPLRIAPVSHYVLNSSGHETYYKEHDWYYWGMQIEPGDVVTSYMGNYVGDSTNSTGERLRTQRGADCLFMDGQEFKDFYNVVESSIVMQYSHYNSSTNTGAGTRPFKISAQTGSDTRIDYVSTNQYHPYIAADGNAVVGATGLVAGTTLFDGQTNKIAVKVKHQDFASTINGGTVATNTSGSWPPENKMDLLTLGALNKDGGGVLKGHIQRFTYYPVGLTNNQLVTLTS